MVPQMLPLWSKSDKYYQRLMTGAALGRRWNVWDYFRTHFQILGQVGKNLFYYKGYDDQDFFREIEKRLFYYGRCGIVQHNGDLIAVDANGYEPGIYDRPEKFTFVFRGGVPDNSPTPNEREIGKGGVYAYNTYDGFATACLVEHYALMLAHTDASITLELVNGRMMDVINASDNNGVEAASAYSKKIYDGEYSFLQDRSENLVIDRANSSRNSKLRELLETKEKLYHDVYALFGINRVAEKRERLITDEAEGSGPMLLLNIKDMLSMREKMCDDINNVFGTNITVQCHIDIDADGTLEHTAEAERPDPETQTEKGGADNV